MSEQIAKAEAGICAYLRGLSVSHGLFAGVTFYEGHGIADHEALPRVVVVGSGAGGDAANSGIYKISLAFKPVGELKSMDNHAATVGTLLHLFCEDKLKARADDIPPPLVALNKPAEGVDTRLVKGWGISGLAFLPEGQQEGRDTERALHGAILPYEAWVHLEAE